MFVRRLSLLLALALIGSALVSGPASAATPVDLRVMEFNIEYGGTVVSFDSIVRAVQAADADVVGVEEGFGNVPRLADALGYPYYNVRLQVVSRFPLIDRAAAGTVCTCSSRPLRDRSSRSPTCTSRRARTARTWCGAARSDRRSWRSNDACACPPWSLR